jgi:hypothetical protein
MGHAGNFFPLAACSGGTVLPRDHIPAVWAEGERIHLIVMGDVALATLKVIIEQDLTGFGCR